MAYYRLYCMDGLGKSARVELLEAKNDDDAVSLAWAKKLSVTCEVWDGNRLVAQIPAHSWNMAGQGI